MSAIVEPKTVVDSSDSHEPHLPSQKGEPVWDIALLFPSQGDWTEEEYLALDSNRLIEFSDGFLEFLPLPTKIHQRIVLFLYNLLNAYVLAHQLGEAFTAPLRIRLWSRKVRQPDVVYLSTARAKDPQEPTVGADLAIEVLSPGENNRDRDLVIKLQEYAKARIPEYWIVDPQLQQITVLVLEGETYREHGVFKPGMQATSVLLPGFMVDVTAMLVAGSGPQTTA
jgi:Uma2 family endonuclease